MTQTSKTILIGGLGFLLGFLQQLLSYVQGLRDTGGTWGDFDSITVASFLLVSVVGAVAALMAYLADAPADKRLLSPVVAPLRSDNVDIDLSIDAALDSTVGFNGVDYKRPRN